MGSDLADLVFTDPPYGVSYIGSNNPNGKSWEMIKNDDLRGERLNYFLFNAFKNMEKFSNDYSAFYVFYASSTHIEFETALNSAGIKVKEQIIWSKGMVLGHSDYHWAHEPCLYCKKENGRTRWFGFRDNKTVIGKKRKEYQSMTKEQLVDALSIISKNSSVWEIDRDNVTEYVHPTQKPTHLAVRAIKNSSQKGEIVLDLFGGSGTTIIASEKTGRIARVMEFDPKYCDVIRKRWGDWCSKNDLEYNDDKL
jgi:DNA modification methylase